MICISFTSSGVCGVSASFRGHCSASTVYETPRYGSEARLETGKLQKREKEGDRGSVGGGYADDGV